MISSSGKWTLSLCRSFSLPVLLSFTLCLYLCLCFCLGFFLCLVSVSVFVLVFLSTEVPEIQDVEGPKPLAPPYRSAHWAKMDLFWSKDPSGESNKDHCRNFLNFHPRAVIEGIKVAKSTPFRDHNIAQNSGFKPKYSTLRGKTDKLEEPVNRELNVTKNWNFIQTVILA